MNAVKLRNIRLHEKVSAVLQLLYIYIYIYEDNGRTDMAKLIGALLQILVGDAPDNVLTQTFRDMAPHSTFLIDSWAARIIYRNTTTLCYKNKRLLLPDLDIEISFPGNCEACI